MEDVIQIQDQFYILATASKAAERTAVLKHGDTFAVFDYSGDIGAFGTGRARPLSRRHAVPVPIPPAAERPRPLLLSARVKDDNELFGADLTNPDIPLDDGSCAGARSGPSVPRAVSVGRHLARAHPPVELQPRTGRTSR